MNEERAALASDRLRDRSAGARERRAASDQRWSRQVCPGHELGFVLGETCDRSEARHDLACARRTMCRIRLDQIHDQGVERAWNIAHNIRWPRRERAPLLDQLERGARRKGSASKQCVVEG